MSVRKSRENYRQIYGKSKESLWRNLSTGTPPIFFRTILCFVALVYNWYFFFRTAVLRKLFDIRFSYKHCNFSHVCLLVKSHSRWRRKPWQGLHCFTVTFTVDLSRIHWHHAYIQVSHKICEFSNINLKQDHPARLSTLVSLQKHVSSDHMQTDILKFLRNSDIFPRNNHIFLAFTLSGLTYF